MLMRRGSAAPRMLRSSAMACSFCQWIFVGTVAFRPQMERHRVKHDGECQ
jgi:hypothetical protein